MLNQEKNFKGFITTALTISIGLVVYKLVSKAMSKGESILPSFTGFEKASASGDIIYYDSSACDILSEFYNQTCEDYCVGGGGSWNTNVDSNWVDGTVGSCTGGVVPPSAPPTSLASESKFSNFFSNNR